MDLVAKRDISKPDYSIFNLTMFIPIFDEYSYKPNKYDTFEWPCSFWGCKFDLDNESSMTGKKVNMKSYFKRLKSLHDNRKFRIYACVLLNTLHYYRIVQCSWRQSCWYIIVLFYIAIFKQLWYKNFMPLWCILFAFLLVLQVIFSEQSNFHSCRRDCKNIVLKTIEHYWRKTPVKVTWKQ